MDFDRMIDLRMRAVLADADGDVLKAVRSLLVERWENDVEDGVTFAMFALRVRALAEGRTALGHLADELMARAERLYAADGAGVGNLLQQAEDGLPCEEERARRVWGVVVRALEVARGDHLIAPQGYPDAEILSALHVAAWRRLLDDRVDLDPSAREQAMVDDVLDRIVELCPPPVPIGEPDYDYLVGR